MLVQSFVVFVVLSLFNLVYNVDLNLAFGIIHHARFIQKLGYLTVAYNWFLKVGLTQNQQCNLQLGSLMNELARQSKQTDG